MISPTTQDRDDAFWLHRQGDNLQLTVAIATVAARVPPGSPLDERARRRGWTHYRAQERVDPLLPAAATAQWSLGATADQPVLALQAQIAPDGTITASLHEARLARTLICSYAEVGALLATPHPADPAPADLPSMLRLAAGLAPRLLARRQARGALAVFDLVGGLTSTEEGALLRLGPEQRHIGYLIVQELMILANELIAGWAAGRDLPLLYRNHQARAVAPPRAQLLADLTLAQQHPEQVSPATLAGIWNLVLDPAYYAPHIAGHYGLNLPVYTHATSPLRRYADLRNQQILLAALRGTRDFPGGDLAALGRDLTERERARKAATGAALKAQAQTLAYTQGAGPDLTTLGPDPFYQVLKVRLRAGAVPEAVVGGNGAAVRGWGAGSPGSPAGALGGAARCARPPGRGLDLAPGPAGTRDFAALAPGPGHGGATPCVSRSRSRAGPRALVPGPGGASGAGGRGAGCRPARPEQAGGARTGGPEWAVRVGGPSRL